MSTPTPSPIRHAAERDEVAAWSGFFTARLMKMSGDLAEAAVKLAEVIKERDALKTDLEIAKTELKLAQAAPVAVEANA